jgi:hypothetical protein
VIQKEYYVLEREANDGNPLFTWDEPSSKYGLGIPVAYSRPVKLRLGDLLWPDFEWVGYHELPEPVLSESLFN